VHAAGLCLEGKRTLYGETNVPGLAVPVTLRQCPARGNVVVTASHVLAHVTALGRRRDLLLAVRHRRAIGRTLLAQLFLFFLRLLFFGRRSRRRPRLRRRLVRGQHPQQAGVAEAATVARQVRVHLAAARTGDVMVP